jgi:hypothetical protein
MPEDTIPNDEEQYLMKPYILVSATVWLGYPTTAEVEKEHEEKKLHHTVLTIDDHDKLKRSFTLSDFEARCAEIISAGYEPLGAPDISRKEKNHAEVIITQAFLSKYR